MDHPAVEPLEELLGTTDRRVERHLLAGGIAVEGDVEVVNPGAGQGNSSVERFYGVRTHGLSGMAELIARQRNVTAAGRGRRSPSTLAALPCRAKSGRPAIAGSRPRSCPQSALRTAEFRRIQPT